MERIILNNIIKRITTFAVAAVMMVSITGCGKKQSSGYSPDTKLVSEYPLKTDEKLVWATWTTSHSDYLDYKQQPFFKGLIEQTGVDIDFKFDVVGESFNLMLASRELPDVIQYDWYNIKGGPEKQIDDGIIYDLNDAIDKWAPNLKKYLDEHPDVARDLKTDSGKYYVFPFLRGDERLGVFEGMMVRKDILDKLNLDVPETIEEWETALTAMKNDGVKIPLSFEGSNCKPIMAAYNVNDTFFINDGKIEFGPMQDGWKEYLKTMNKWYNAGLIDPDYGTITKQILTGRLSSGNVGAAAGPCGSVMGVAIAATSVPDFKLVGAKYPVLNKGDKPEFGTAETIYNPNSGVAITTQCKNVELATKVLDYAYSEKGHLLYNFGIEGESYEMVDGKPTFKEEMYNYDKGDITASLKRYIMSIDHAPCIQDKGMYDQRLSYQEQKDAIELWADTNMKNHIIPHISFNQDENDIISDIWLDIDTYVQESTTAFILGRKSIDEFDDYVQTLKNMGIDKVIAARQSAYERYLSR